MLTILLLAIGGYLFILFGAFHIVTNLEKTKRKGTK